MTLVSTALSAHDASRTRGASLPVASGNAIRIIDAALRGIRAGERAVLATVLETEGSTYAGTGAMAVFGEGGHVGWLSGGCLEPEIERCASAAASSGAIGWLDRNGDVDLNILIRSAEVQGSEVVFRTGAGIVADSVPERELDETRAKARGLLRALEAS